MPFPEQQAARPEPVQPDPMLHEGRAHPLKIAAVFGGAAIVVTLVFYGMTRQGPEQVATAPTEAPATTQAPAATSTPPSGAKAQADQSKAQPAKPKAPAETTGQATPQAPAQAPPATANAPAPPAKPQDSRSNPGSANR